MIAHPAAAKIQSFITQACDELSINLTAQQYQQLVDYVFLFEKWNKTYNLSAIKDIEFICKRHIVDGLSIKSVVEDLSPKVIADIGTGGGIPGIVLAIVFPELFVYLIESVGKKCRFLTQACIMLNLTSRVSVVNQRVEQWQPDQTLDFVICRAFSALDKFVTITQHLDKGGMRYIAMKSDDIALEEMALDGIATVVDRVWLNVPFEQARRQVLVIKKERVAI